jgi:hypothetical protein
LIQLSSSIAIILHADGMTSEKPTVDHGDVRDPSLDSLSGGSNPQYCAARRLPAVIMAIESDLLARIVKANELRERSQASMSATTEIIAISQEAIARSRNLLDGGRHEQAAKKPTFAIAGFLVLGSGCRKPLAAAMNRTPPAGNGGRCASIISSSVIAMPKTLS